MFPVLDFSQGSDFYIISKLYTSTQTLNFINAKNIGQHGSIIIYFEDIREQGEAGGEFSNPNDFTWGSGWITSTSTVNVYEEQYLVFDYLIIETDKVIVIENDSSVLAFNCCVKTPTFLYFKFMTINQLFRKEPNLQFLEKLLKELEIDSVTDTTKTFTRIDIDASDLAKIMMESQDVFREIYLPKFNVYFKI